MEGSLKLVGYKFSPTTQLIQLAARQAGVTLEVENLPWDAEARRQELKSQTPTGTFPYLQTSEGVVSESNAICQYIAEAHRPELLGATAFEKAQVRQWVEFANSEVGRNSRAIIYPLFGWGEYNKVQADAASKDLKEQLTVLNRHLEGRTNVVGSAVTLADLNLFAVLRFYYQLVFVEDQRKKLYPNITAWFTTLAASEAAIRAYGRTVLCKVPAKAPKVAEKKEEPKKEAKKEEKPKKAEGEEEEKPEKKKGNPLDLLPPSNFVLDDFKREFLNTPDKAASLAKFWTTYDPEGYSLYWMQYQKLPTEGKVLFKTNNFASIFLQKFDTFRKYSFSAFGVYGTEGDYEVRGVWMWRGTEIPQEVRDHDNFEWMTLRKLDHTVEADRKLLEEYWLNLTPGQIVDGLPVAEVEYFK